MKKLRITIMIIILLFPSNIYAIDDRVKLYKCIDGDTAKFRINNQVYSVRFLAIDTPEINSKKKKQYHYGKKASKYTCNRLKSSKKIELEYDQNSLLLDKYNRLLAWVFLDDHLLQEELIEKGLAKVAYIFGDYQYTDLLRNKEKIAKIKKVGIWSKE